MSSLEKPIESIDQYIRQFDEDRQVVLQKIRDIILKNAPEAEERIRYGIPTFYFKENLVHFASFKKHIGFYPTPSGISEFSKELSSYKTAKGSVQFPLNRPVPYDLIERIVRFRVEEILGDLPV